MTANSHAIHVPVMMPNTTATTAIAPKPIASALSLRLRNGFTATPKVGRASASLSRPTQQACRPRERAATENRFGLPHDDRDGQSARCLAGSVRANGVQTRQGRLDAVRGVGAEGDNDAVVEAKAGDPLSCSRS